MEGLSKHCKLNGTAILKFEVEEAGKATIIVKRSDRWENVSDWLRKDAKLKIRVVNNWFYPFVIVKIQQENKSIQRINFIDKNGRTTLLQVKYLLSLGHIECGRHWFRIGRKSKQYLQHEYSRSYSIIHLKSLLILPTNQMKNLVP